MMLEIGSLIAILISFFLGRMTSPSKAIIIKEAESAKTVSTSPIITVVFQQDLAEDEELSQQIADMYISHRAFYYSGIQPTGRVLSEKEADTFIYYTDIDFNQLQKINV